MQVSAEREELLQEIFANGLAARRRETTIELERYFKAGE
jgi:hypothetical protein